MINVFIMLQIFLLSNLIIYCTGQYLTSEQGNFLPEPESSKEVTARSQIECILKCQRMENEALYTTHKKCLCVMKSSISASVSGESKGTLYSKQTEVCRSIYIYLY